MKKTLVFAALAAIFSLASCEQKETIQVQRTPAVNVTTEKLNPATDESGTVRAYAGTQVTAKGLNLDMVGAVKIDGVDATIVSKEMKTLVFEIPVLAKAQNDDPYRVDLEIFEDKTDKLIFKYDYYVTVPVTDALVSGFAPKAGTVGTEVTVSGRNLEQITSVSFGGVSVAVADFVSSAADAVVVAVPAVTVTAADTQLDVAAVWSGGTIAMEDKFTLSVPVFAAYSQAAPALLGDEIVLTGENLDLVKAVKWGDDNLLVADQSATSITIKVPTGLELQNPAVVSKALTAVHGVKADQVITVLADFKVDTTPVGPAAPVFTSATPAEAAYTAMYLGREVVVKGQNMASVEKFKVDGVEAALTAEATDIEARFIMPRTITGTAAREVDLIAVWNGGNELDCGKITVYPFFYTKGLKLGKGCAKALYTDFDSSNAFLMLDEGTVISADEWSTRPVDPFCTGSANSLVTGGSKIATGKETEYYSVKPYIFMSVTSNTNLQFNNPANSNSQMKTHRLSDLSTALPSTFGSPVVFMGKVSDEGIVASVSGGSVTDIDDGMPLGGSSTPRWKSLWEKGDVLVVQYLKYSHVSTTGGKPTDASQVYKTGYIYIRDITTPLDGSNIDSGGYVEVDLYWSNVLE